MPNVARFGDQCGGTIVPMERNLFVDGLPVACIGDRVTPHGKGKHAAATLITGSSDYFCLGIPVCRVGDQADCGHTITTGSFDHTNDG